MRWVSKDVYVRRGKFLRREHYNIGGSGTVSEPAVTITFDRDAITALYWKLVHPKAMKDSKSARICRHFKKDIQAIFAANLNVGEAKFEESPR